MAYKSMRFRKYYDALRTNKPFLKTSPLQKIKITKNMIKFFMSGKRLILKNKPITAQIEPTSECNLKCSMCVREKIGVPIGTMPFEDFKKIVDKIGCLFKIQLSGQGEPFLNKDIFKMIDYANKKGILVNLNTNGMLLTKNIIDKICNVEIGEIAISIESTKPKEFEKIRKGAKFDIVMENIRNLNKAIKEKRKKTIVSFAVTILKRNIEEIPKFVELASKKGIKKLIVQTIQEKEDYVSKYNSNAKSQGVSKMNEKMMKKILDAKKISEKKDITFIFDEEESNGCIWPWRGIYISWNGYVTACCKILDYRKPMMGNLLKEDFWDIWNGKEYQMFRKLLKKRRAPLPCKGCKIV